MGRERAERGGREAEVLASLWAAGSPLTAGEVADAMGGDLAYTTVQTILARLYEKGAVTRRRVGRAHAYQAVLDQAGLAARQMRATLDRGGNRVEILRHFLADLRRGDEGALRDALRDIDEQAWDG